MKKLITHNGSFHADDIFAAATLSLLLEKKGEDFSITRTRDEETIKNGDYVFDVGGIYDEATNRFDHHQVGGAGKRDSKAGELAIEYSSVGLVWKKFGAELTGDAQTSEIIDRRLIAPIDAGDNGMELFESTSDISPYLLQSVIGAMRPTWREEEGRASADGARHDFAKSEDEIFLQCVELAKTILNREMIHAKDALLAEKELLKIYNDTEDKRIIILDKENYPFENVLSRFSEPLFVICKRKTNHTWGAKAVRAGLKTFKNRKNFPAEWAGLSDAELQKVSGVSDAIFCHRALFLAVAQSKEGAIALAQKALAN